jgi:hypothetical protein
MYKTYKKINDKIIVPCKKCIFYINNNNNNKYFAKCGRFLNIYKEYYNVNIAKRKFCDNNLKYIK